eukprot:3784128-Prymnesium_polylepis.1
MPQDDKQQPSTTPAYDAITARLPPPPLLAAGALGGPFVISSLTPLRNAMSNASQDQRSTLPQLYQRAMGSPTLGIAQRLRVGYTGALVSAGPACPQWCIIGPAFHVFHAYLPTPLALLGTAMLETFITFGSQTRNAQMAYNVQEPKAAVPLSNIVRPWGPGAPFYVLRNFCGMAGIRWISPPIQQVLEPVVPSGPREVVSDMSASMLTCVVSAPLNACWSYIVTTPSTWSMLSVERTQQLAPFLRRQYLDETGSRLSRVAMRDFAVRCVYIACCFSMFSGIERLAVRYWPAGRKSEK